jgi:mxaA protein
MRVLTLMSLFLVSLQLQADDASISLDRSWGLLVGDRVTATITLPVAVDDLDSHSFPQLEKRYGPWLYLHDSQQAGNQLTLNFQLINVPAENRQVETPELQLRTEAGDFITVPTTRMQIGSFMQQSGDAETATVPAPRGDMRLLPMAADELRWQRNLALLVVVLSSLVWLVWHFGLRPRHRLPFATAMFELNKMRLLGRKNADAASRCLHQAFNRSAGRVVINSELEGLWQQCPWLSKHKAEIERFYLSSAAHYFSRKPAEPLGFDAMLKLARACREQERLA